MDKKDIAAQVIRTLYANEGISTTKRLPDLPRHEIVSAIKKIEPNISTKDYTKIIGELRSTIMP